MFQRLYELSQCLPERAAWERLNEGMPEHYNRGLALCFDPAGEWRGVKTRQGNADVIYRSGQYGKLGYVIKGLDPDLAGAWVACGDTWRISDDEATFAFTIRL